MWAEHTEAEMGKALRGGGIGGSGTVLAGLRSCARTRRVAARLTAEGSYERARFDLSGTMSTRSGRREQMSLSPLRIVDNFSRVTDFQPLRRAP